MAPEEGNASVSLPDKLKPDADMDRFSGLPPRNHEGPETSADMALSTDVGSWHGTC